MQTTQLICTTRYLSNVGLDYTIDRLKYPGRANKSSLLKINKLSLKLHIGNFSMDGIAMLKKLCFGLLFLIFLSGGDLLAACTSTIALDTDVTDSWDTDCDSEHRSNRYAKYFTFTLETSREVSIDLESSVDTYLFLLEGADQTGTVLEEDDDSGKGANSKIVRFLQAGTYTVEATTFVIETTGDFDVSVNTEVAPPSACGNLIGANSSESGEWSAICTSTNRNGSYAKYYKFTLLGSSKVTIDLESEVDTYLYLIEGPEATGSVISENDDSGNLSNSRIVAELSAGTYTIEATTFSAAETGSFVVSVESISACVDCPFEINAGLNDAWYNPATNGQGFLVTVFPDIEQMYVAWFTFDTERPPDSVTAELGDPGHRWLTAQGPYDGDSATLRIFVTEGGVFDAAEPPATTDPAGDGTLVIEFVDCTEALATYEITSLDISGVIPLERIVTDNVSLCEVLSNP